MSRPISKSIYKIAEKNETNKIVIFTQYLKIDGELNMPERFCEECHEDIITLEDATVCRLKDYCECNDSYCDCNDYACFRYDWLNINVDEIVAYSILA